MKNVNINMVLQIVALLFLLLIGYMIFSASGNWKIVASELEKANKELKMSKDTLVVTKKRLENQRLEFIQMKAQKELIIHKRDSLLFAFKKKNARDWDELQNIKDSIEVTNNQIAKDRLLLNDLFGLNP